MKPQAPMNKSLLSLVLVAAVAAGGTAALLRHAPLSAQPATAPVNARGLPDFTDLVDAVGPSVVNIRTLERSAPARPGAAPGGAPDEEMLEFFRRFGVPIPNQPRQQRPALREALQSTARIDKSWSIASFSRLTRDLSSQPVWTSDLNRGTARPADDEPALEEPVMPAVAVAPWHRFARGPSAGNFLHDQMEWLAGDGFALQPGTPTAERLAKRCERAGFKAQAEGLALWACADGSGYWIATDQFKDRSLFHVFDRQDLAYRGAFAGEKTANTDGVWLHQAATARFPAGVFYAVHDDMGVAAFDWRDVAKALDLRADCGA